MKRLIILLALLVPGICLAGNVSEQRARIAAENFFGGARTKSSELTLLNSTKSNRIFRAYTQSSTQTGTARAAKLPARKAFFQASSDDQLPIYIYARSGGGFVIISGDDALSPVLAFSKTNNFVTGDIPQNIQDVLEDLESCVEYVRQHNVSADSRTKKEWDAISSGEYAAPANQRKLTTARYNQLSPYNDMIPKEKDGSACYCGCVATATSIIMKYHKHPEKGTGTIPAYTTGSPNYFKIPAIELGHEYNWDIMLDYYNPNTGKSDSGTDESREEIARLVYEVAAMVQMDFSSDGSGAVTGDVANGLFKYFGYASTYHRTCNLYSTSEWLSMIKESIDNDCPVLYSGRSDSGGHAFVADGYADDGYVSINFGWGGSSNDWYKFPEFSKYKNSHGATFNIRPGSGSPAESFADLSVNDMQITSGSPVTVGQKFTVVANSVRIEGNSSYNNYVKLRQVNSLGEVKADIKSSSISLDIGYYYPSLTFSNCVINSNIEFDDALVLYYQKGSEWVPLLSVQDQPGNYYPLGTQEMFESQTTASFDKQNKKFRIDSGRTAKYTITSGGIAISAAAYKVTDGDLELDTSQLKSGTYVISVTAGNFSKELKLTL